MNRSTESPMDAACAVEALSAYDLPDGATVRLISFSENATFLIEAGKPLAVLRVYRPGYQSETSMESELAWIGAIRQSGQVNTPGLVLTRDGRALHWVEIAGEKRAVAVFDYIAGNELKGGGGEDLDTVAKVGQVAAMLHNQVSAWQRPGWFERHTWDIEAILGRSPRWGDWRDGPGLDEDGRELLKKVELRLRERLAGYHQDATNAGLVHCDLRAANVLVDNEDRLWVIDFDDCGFSWFLWDLCSTTTFIEHLPQVDDVVSAWLEGYLRTRPLVQRDLDVLPDLVVLRRLHILAWLGSHPESDLAGELGTSYTHATYDVARQYMADEYLRGVDRGFNKE